MKRIFLAILGAIMIGVGSLTMVQPTYAAECATNKEFLGFRPWYKGLCQSGSDELELEKLSGADDTKLSKFIWTAVLNVTFDVSLAIGYIALAMVIYGGYLYIMSQGDVVRATKAKKTLMSAAVGAVIAMGATVIVNTATTILGISSSGGWDQGEFTRDRLMNIFDWAYAAAGLVAVVFIIKSGVEYMLSRGDPSKTQTATRGLIFSIVGLVIVILASLITNVILNAIGGAL